MKASTRLYLLLYIVCIGFNLTNCSDDSGSAPAAGSAALTTAAVTGITSAGATSGGSITADGGSAITARGIVWGTATTPTVALTTKTTDGTGTGTFTSTITALSPNTTYFVRAYATNNAGTAYGNEVTFATPALPVVTTTAITLGSGSTATSGGNITADGGTAITARGIVWNTEPNPTVALTTKTTDGTGTGTYTSTLTNLTDGTVYYVRAYATNAAGTSYGNELSIRVLTAFTELDNAIAAQMKNYNIPAVSIAIVRNEKLVYVKSYGMADKEANQPATNDNLYRIASISKPITAIMILKLVQEGKLTLDQKVFGTGAILGTDYGTPPTADKETITIRHLVNHTSGWTNSPSDPMFSDVNNTQKQIITDMLTNRPLATAPGAKEYYLNFGYSVLGRVIEKITGQTYDAYVQSVVKNMGITSFALGGNTLADRKPNEVKYYQSEYSPYAMNITRMDSHGGWLSTATDLARFITYIDRNNNVPDIITTDKLNEMYFGLESWAHTGSLPGTSTLLVREDNTFSFVVLANTRTQANVNTILNALYTAVSQPLHNRPSWPDYNLF